MTGIANRLLQAFDRWGPKILLVGNRACARPSWTGAELATAVRELAAALIARQMQAGNRIGMIADNCDHWLVADLASLAAGLVTVPRARDVSRDEVSFVLEHSGSQAVFVEDQKLAERLTEVLEGGESAGPVILMKGSADGVTIPGREVLDLDTLRREGREHLSTAPECVDDRGRTIADDHLATIVYTSGTTGNPKGVRLTHGNILHNLRSVPQVIDLLEDDRYLSFLPTWHSFERTLEYCLLDAGCEIYYSSKTGLRRDMPKSRPTILAGVPRLWETMASSVLGSLEKLPPAKRALVTFLLKGSVQRTEAERLLKGQRVGPSNKIVRAAGIGRLLATLKLMLWHLCHVLADKLVYVKLRQALGGEIRFAVSGGGALQAHVDEFFNRAGVCLLNGYGLTETAPIISLRVPSNNVLTTAGRRLPETEWRVRDEDNTKSLPQGEKGVLWVRGPQVMDGYHKNEEATRRILVDGWFCTGDLAALTDDDQVMIQGRAKDTIVLRGGENVEPELIEAPLLTIPYLQDVILVGHGEKHLAALVIPNLEQLCLKLPDLDPEDLGAAARDPRVGELIHGTIRETLSTGNGFRVFEQVPKIICLSAPFSTENGTLTLTLKKKRPAIESLYADAIAAVYKDGSEAVHSTP